MNFDSKCYNFRWGKCIWKCPLQNGGHFVLTWMCWITVCSISIWLNRKCRHFDEIFITGCTESCQNDNFRCSQWWKFRQNDDISGSRIAMGRNTISYWGRDWFGFKFRINLDPVDKNPALMQMMAYFSIELMMTSLIGNIFRVTGHLCGEFTGPRWIPCTKASDAELWCFVWSASE